MAEKLGLKNDPAEEMFNYQLHLVLSNVIRPEIPVSFHRWLWNPPENFICDNILNSCDETTRFVFGGGEEEYYQPYPHN